MKIERIIAIIAFCFTISIILCNIFFPPKDEHFVSKAIVLFLLIVSAILFLIIIIKPGLSVLYALVFYYEGLFSVADGEGVTGMLFIFCAACFAFKYGFFRKYKVFKIATLFVMVLISVVVGIIGLPFVFFKNFLEIVLYIIVFFILYAIFKNDLRQYLLKKPKYCLSEHGLSPKEAIYLIASIEGQSMKEIAADHQVDLSTVKTGLHRAYQKLNVPDCKSFIIRTKDMEVIP